MFLTERGLTAMWNRITLLRAEQSRAEQSRASRAEQSRAEQSYNCALFAPCGCEAFESEYYIYDKNIHWMFLLYAKACDG